MDADIILIVTNFLLVIASFWSVRVSVVARNSAQDAQAITKEQNKILQIENKLLSVYRESDLKTSIRVQNKSWDEYFLFIERENNYSGRSRRLLNTEEVAISSSLAEKTRSRFITKQWCIWNFLNQYDWWSYSILAYMDLNNVVAQQSSIKEIL